MTAIHSKGDVGMRSTRTGRTTGVVPALVTVLLLGAAAPSSAQDAAGAPPSGDAATQAKRLEALGFGTPVMIKDLMNRLDN